MSGFFKEEEIKNQAADAPWKKSERDYVLDSHLAGGDGSHPRTIAQKIGRNPKAVRRLIEQFTYNERDRVIRYEPFKRTSRKGKKLTQNEIAILKSHKEKGVAIEESAKLLCRGVEELSGKVKMEAAGVKKFATIAPTLDLIWAHRYIYFVWKTPVISDAAYNDLVKEEMEYGGGGTNFARIKLHQGWPDHIKSLALFLDQRRKWEGKGKDEG
jgi:hypothetical protein